MTCSAWASLTLHYGMIGYIGAIRSARALCKSRIRRALLRGESNMDPVERVEQFKQLQQMIADDVPYVIMCQIDNSYGVNDSVNMNPRLDDVWNLVNIRAA